MSTFTICITLAVTIPTSALVAGFTLLAAIRSASALPLTGEFRSEQLRARERAGEVEGRLARLEERIDASRQWNERERLEQGRHLEHIRDRVEVREELMRGLVGDVHSSLGSTQRAQENLERRVASVDVRIATVDSGLGRLEEAITSVGDDYQSTADWRYPGGIVVLRPGAAIEVAGTPLAITLGKIESRRLVDVRIRDRRSGAVLADPQTLTEGETITVEASGAAYRLRVDRIHSGTLRRRNASVHVERTG